MLTPEQQSLIDKNKNLIESEIRKYSSHIPEAAMRIEAYKLQAKQAQNFNPNQGVKFTTYLVNALQKLTRLSTSYGGFTRLPESKQFKLNKLNSSKNELQQTLGRDPTVQEISQKQGISLSESQNLLSHRQNVLNLGESSNTAMFGGGENEEWIHFVYHDLAPRDKLVFEHLTGFGGKSILGNKEIAKKLGVSSTTLGKRISFIHDQLSQGARM